MRGWTGFWHDLPGPCTTLGCRADPSGVAGGLSTAASRFLAAASRLSRALGFGSADAFLPFLLRQSSRDTDTLLPMFPTGLPNFAAPASHYPHT